MPVLLSTAYFPPLSYMVALSASMRQCNFAYVEACENYQKQSYRNRCDFYAASGRQSLIVPVVHEGGTFSHPITEIRIDRSKPWLQQHIRAIVSAYKKAAFFDYYWDGILAILESQPETLWELNLTLLRHFLDILSLPADLRFTESFVPSSRVPAGTLDLREAIHPKRPDRIMGHEGMKKPYFQVFACKHGFIPNLSVIDLLFNEGPDADSYFRI